MNNSNPETREERVRSDRQVRRKVDFNIFVWTVATLSGIMLVVSGYLFSEMAAMRVSQAESMAKSEGLIKELAAKLEAEREKNTSVLITLAEIRGDMKLIKDQLDRVPKR